MNLGDKVRHVTTNVTGVIVGLCQDLFEADSVKVMLDKHPKEGIVDYQWVNPTQLEYVGESEFSSLSGASLYVGEGYKKIKDEPTLTNLLNPQIFGDMEPAVPEAPSKPKPPTTLSGE